jgi:iron complex transport system ATP-binding protein
MVKYNVDHAFFKYISDYVIRDITLDLKPNTINVLIGLNGSGKTTLIKLLSGILKPNKGTISINDKDIFDYTYLERSKYISYVAQGIHTGDDYLVEEYLSFGLMNTLKFYESPTKDSLKKVKEAAVKFGIEKFLDKKMNELSGGERQVVSICRAYIQDTKIMILDEPTSALDFKNQNLVLNILKEVASIGKTIILSTHNPNHALYLDSYALLIDQGEIVKRGNARDVVTKEVLASVYGDDLKYSKELEYDEITI